MRFAFGVRGGADRLGRWGVRPDPVPYVGSDLAQIQQCVEPRTPDPLIIPARPEVRSEVQSGCGHKSRPIMPDAVLDNANFL